MITQQNRYVMLDFSRRGIQLPVVLHCWSYLFIKNRLHNVRHKTRPK